MSSLVETVTVRGCSDAAIAPLVTSRRTRLSNLSLATNAVSVSVDMRGNETVSVTALDPATQTSFSTTVLPGLNNVATNWYNDGMVVSNRSHSAVVTETRYDALRRETARIDGRGNVSWMRYDAFGCVAATIDALTNATAYAYDAMGRVAAVTNALGEVSEYAYDTRGNRISERGATYPVDYTYDAYGDKIAMTTYRDESLATGDTTHWFYDESSGTLTNKVYADGQGPRYEYDANGRLAKRIWARGVETFYAYDGWGNLTNTAYSDNTPTIALRYDALGRQVEAHDAAGVTTFIYDDYGVLTNETVIGVAGTNIIERYYDTFGRNAGYALNGIRQTTLGYDPATGRLATMRTAERRSGVLTASDENEFVWSYLPNSDLKASLLYPNGLTAFWTYDANSQLLQVRNATPTNILSQYDYTYDAAGRRIARAHSGAAFAQSDTLNYTYNIRSELTNAVASVDSNYTYAYDFDEIGNRRTSSECGVRSAEYAANELNQYTAISTDTSALFVSPREIFTPLFDADGNQTRVKTATGTWQVSYNGENRPILWTCGETNIVMSYDRMGRRVTKSAECGGQSAECCRFVYDGYLQIANHHSTSTPTPSTYTYFIWDPTEPIATRPLVWFNSALDTPSAAHYYTHDGNKNVSEVIDDNGDIAAHYEYAPFGAVVAQSGESAAANPWRFSSEFADDDTVMVCYVYRHYEPLIGRWLQRDQIEVCAGINPISICENNMMNMYDYLGAVGITIAKNSYKVQKFRVVSETVYCRFVECDKCHEPCEWNRLNEEIVDLPLAVMTQTYSGGLTKYEIAHGIAEEVCGYGMDKAKGLLLDKILNRWAGADIPSLPFQDELDAIASSKYKDYLLPGTYHVPGYEQYIFTGYDHSITATYYYPSFHLEVPSCQSRNKTSMYYVPIGLPRWTDEKP